MEGLLGPNAANGCPMTPLGFLERAATVYGDCPSVVYDDNVYTWSQTLDRCLRLASALCNLGVSPGDVVSVRGWVSGLLLPSHQKVEILGTWVWIWLGRGGGR